MITVRVYLVSNSVVEFPARSERNAREIAKRIMMEGFWTNDDGAEEFYPTHQVYKVKLVQS